MALIKLIPVEPKIGFIAKRQLALVCSGLIVLASLALFFFQGLNYGVDFRGGVMLEIRTEAPADLGALRSQLNALGLGSVTLQALDEDTDVLINVQRQEGGDEAQNQAVLTVKEALGDTVAEYRRTEFVGPKVGDELKEAGLLATILALGAIAVYIWFRFEWQFSMAALVALIHDVIATIGFFVVTQLEFNLASVAAILTIAGYSINDTVVVFDRVREYLRKFKKAPLGEVLDLALNSTLSRTMLTSLTTLLALIALSVFGGHVIRGFSLALVWGVVIGTYSSIAVATPLLMSMNLRHSDVAKPSKASEEAAGD